MARKFLGVDITFVTLHTTTSTTTTDVIDDPPNTVYKYSMSYQNRTTAPNASATSNPALEQLLRRRDVWRGHGTHTGEVISSGHAKLDPLLQGNGWPLGALVDVSQVSNGHGEWQLFGPAIAKLSQQAGLVLLFNPPALPYGPGLVQLGINHRTIRVVRSQQRQTAIAALIDILNAHCCLAIMAWEGQLNWRYAELRKLQLAASSTASLCLCLRQDRPGRVQSPAPLRLRSQLTQQGLEVQLLKQRGQHQPQLTTLAVPSLWAPNHADLMPNEPAVIGTGHEHSQAKVLNFTRAPGSLPATQTAPNTVPLPRRP